MKPEKCIGCRYRMPIKFDGFGILCTSADGNCPEWIIKNCINWGSLKPLDSGAKKQARESWNEKLMGELII